MMNLRTRWTIGLLALASVGALSAWWTLKGKADGASKADLVTAERQDLEILVSETGVLQPLTKAEIKSRIAGQVARILVEAGHRVKPGQPLIQLETTDLERGLAQARADRDVARARWQVLTTGARLEDRAIAEAETNISGVSVDEAPAAAPQLHRTEAEFRRAREASGTGTVTPRELNQAEGEFLAARAALAGSKARLAKITSGARREEVAEARALLDKAAVALKAAEDQLAYATIRAPIGGTILRRGIEVGEMVSPGVSATAQGTSILTIGNLDRLIVQSQLNQIDVGQVRVGQTVIVRVDSAPGRLFHGRVSKVAPAGEAPKDANTTLQSFPIETLVEDVDGGVLKPGMSADLDIQITTRKQVVALPVEAVTRLKGDMATVQIVVSMPEKRTRSKPKKEGHREKEGSVTPRGSGGKDGDRRKVRLGLSTDSLVEIVSGLKPGEQVRIQPPSSADNAFRM